MKVSHNLDSVSLSTNRGRITATLRIGDYQRRLLDGYKATSGILFKRVDGYYLGLYRKDDPVDVISTQGSLGVDMGIREIATLSDGTAFSGAELTKHRKQRAKVRHSLQVKAARGTRISRRNCRRVLRRLKGREARFQSWVNHKISRQIVDRARESFSRIAIEDLTGIKERTLPRIARKQRAIHGGWAFHQLRTYIEYKAAIAGVPVVAVNPRYTSQTCATCGERGKRGAKVFTCTRCGSTDADANASRRIAQLGATANSPERSEVAHGCHGRV